MLSIIDFSAYKPDRRTQTPIASEELVSYLPEAYMTRSTVSDAGNVTGVEERPVLYSLIVSRG